jgi:hypothetical protein
MPARCKPAMWRTPAPKYETTPRLAGVGALARRRQGSGAGAQPSFSHLPYSTASLVERRTPSQIPRNKDRPPCQTCPARGRKVKSE